LPTEREYEDVPWGYKTDLIGHAIEIYECESGFFIKFADTEFKQKSPSDLPARLEKIEAELAELKNLLKRSHGLEEIRTPDLRRVKATS
jgi:ribosomal protein L29